MCVMHMSGWQTIVCFRCVRCRCLTGRDFYASNVRAPHALLVDVRLLPMRGMYVAGQQRFIYFRCACSTCLCLGSRRPPTSDVYDMNIWATEVHLLPMCAMHMSDLQRFVCFRCACFRCLAGRRSSTSDACDISSWTARSLSTTDVRAPHAYAWAAEDHLLPMCTM